MQKPTEEDLDGDFQLLGKLSVSKVSQLTANKFLELSDNESDNEFERDIPEDLPEIEPAGY